MNIYFTCKINTGLLQYNTITGNCRKKYHKSKSFFGSAIWKKMNELTKDVLYVQWRVHFCLCVYISSVWTRSQDKYPVSLHLCLVYWLGLQPGADCWTVGMNGSCHLLSLVSQMDTRCTIQSAQSRVTNERDIFAKKNYWQTHSCREGAADGQKSESWVCDEFGMRP